MADEKQMDEKGTPQKSKSRSARLGDRVFLWVKEGGELKPRPAWLTDYSEFSQRFSLVIITPQGALLPYQLMPFSPKPAEFHWTFEDQAKPLPVVAATPEPQ